MGIHSTITPELDRAFRETEYRVYGRPELTLRVGQRNPTLARAQADHGATCSAYVTACNPHSRVSPPDDNARRQAALVAELTHRGLAFLPGIAQHPSNGWSGEESFLVFGLSLDAAEALARALEQTAFVWVGADAVPQLHYVAALQGHGASG